MKKLLFLTPDDATFVAQRVVMAKGAEKIGYEIHVGVPDEGFVNKIKELGFIWHNVDLNRGGINPVSDLIPFLKLVRLLRKEKPYIMQCISIKPGIYGTIAGRLAGLQRIVCLVNGRGYAFEGRGLKGKILKFIAKTLYKIAYSYPKVKVIFQNPDDREYFIQEKLIERDRTYLIRGSGVNMEKFYPEPEPVTDTPVVLFVGRLIWTKGVGELIEATKNLRNEGLKFTLQIIGYPDERNPDTVPKKYLEELNANGTIQWIGRQTDMPRFYRAANILALPTNYNEGLPLTLLEAASCGRCLISTDAPGCREIVRPGVNGILVPPKTVKELTDAMRTLIQDPEMRARFGQNSTRIVKEEFSSEIVVSKLLELYQS
jgi:glycosyltransferase involved in cell wall biosynthesis